MTKGKQSHFRGLCAALLGILLLSACGGKKAQAPDFQGSAEPDKLLYERAVEDIRKGKHTVGRLSLQTLINTYPDSEYLAKAALAVADSYFKEGGTGGLTQAVQEYENFITFFPFLDEAAYAHMQIAMSHFRRMEKPDRDRTFARLAEEALQRFILKYPDHARTAEAEQRLREVQEVLAEGEFRIARWYYIKGSLRAAAARLIDMTERYPLYSQADRALQMLADAFERGERGDLASTYYARIVREYPLSPLVPEAKEKLIALGVPVPQPDPVALARMQKEQEYDRERPGMIRRSLGMFKSGPDVSPAAQTGQPNLKPPSEPVSPRQTLTPARPNLDIEVQPGSNTGGTSSGSSATDGNAGNPSANPASAGATTTDPSKVDLKDAEKKKKEDEKKKKEQEKEKKKQEESSSKKKKKTGLGKLIPW